MIKRQDKMITAVYYKRNENEILKVYALEFNGITVWRSFRPPFRSFAPSNHEHTMRLKSISKTSGKVFRRASVEWSSI